MNESSSSGFVSPEAYSAEWQDFTLVQQRTHSLIYTASRYGRRFLIKALPLQDAGLTDYRLQQEKEFQLGLQLVHPNIAATYSLEDIPDVGPCIVQEWIDGVTLREWLQGKPSRADRERVFGHLLDALEYIHGLQLVHHDLKADNILITRNGTNVKLIDFGLSATDSTLSPVPNDPQKDIQALGRLLPLLLPRQRLLARRCRNARYANIASLRRAVTRRKRFLQWTPVIVSAALLITAAVLFYLARHERHAEQQRFEAMQTLINSYMTDEREQLMQIVSDSRDAYDMNNPEEMKAYYACMTVYSRRAERFNAVRDSLIATFDENDPLREQFWQMWARKQTELYSEISAKMTNKLH